MNELFKWCCDTISVWAKFLGCTYEELNIYLFVLLQPLIVLILVIIIAILFHKYKCYKKLYNATLTRKDFEYDQINRNSK
jgi:hypothetical protein